MPDPSPISTRNSSRTSRKNLSIFPRPCGRPGALWVILIPSRAAARFSAASTKAEPLSTYIRRRGRRWRPAPGAARRPAARCPRSTPSGRPSPPGSGRPGSEQVGLAARRCAGRAARRRSTARSAWSTRTGRSTAGGRPSGLAVSSSRSKCRCRVRTDGDQPQWSAGSGSPARRCAPGFSRFSPAASSSTAASVRGVTCRAGGASAANPPDRQARIQRSIVARDTATGSPNGPSCARAAISRTSRPRCRTVSAGSAASRISWYRNSATCSARAARLRSSSADDIHFLLGENGENRQSPRIPAHRAAAQSQLALATRAGQAGASSSPHVTAAASCHRATSPTPGTRAAATAAAATAATASASGDPAGAGSGGSGTSTAASAVNALPHPPRAPGQRPQPAPHRRRRAAQQPRDHPVPRPGRLRLQRPPDHLPGIGPPGQAPAGSSTCVAPHPRHRDLRGTSSRPVPPRPGPAAAARSPTRPAPRRTTGTPAPRPPAAARPQPRHRLP